MNNEKWISQFRPNDKPNYQGIAGFLPEDIHALFTRFSLDAKDRYGLSLTAPAFSAKYGWTFVFSYKNIPCVRSVKIFEKSFSIDDVIVENENDLMVAMDRINRAFENGFREKAEALIAERNKKQAERSRLRAERERSEMAEAVSRVGRDKLNQFHWTPKVKRDAIRRLYQSDASMRLNAELVDEVGYAVYARCLQGWEERNLADQGKLRCHNCGAILSHTGSELLVCDCGYGYFFRDYMRSYNRNEMPGRSAAPMFNEFVERWPAAKTDEEKMRLIDWVIHQCHLNILSGVSRFFAGLNLIEGSREEVTKLIEQLAYQ